VLVDSWRAVPPVVSSGAFRYPDDPVGELRASNRRVFVVDARATAERIGDPRLANSVILGAAAPLLPFPQETLRDQVMRRFGGSEIAARNTAALDAGRATARR
jgi:indolepyruvate ferredoxin oxidoreductase beta subunit